MPDARVVILERVEKQADHYKFLLWVPVANANAQAFLADVGFISAYSEHGDIAVDHPTILAQLQAGTMLEVIGSDTWSSVAVAQTDLEAVWIDVETKLALGWMPGDGSQGSELDRSGAVRNPMQRFGTNWDGTTWIVAGQLFE